jgi:GDP-L-fucose synthase
MEIAGTTILITGGTGFLGRHVAEELTMGGARVRAIGSSDCDLRHRHQVSRLLDDLRPDAVVHLAAVVGGISANQAEPGRFLYENAVMGLELVEACRVARTQKLLLSGTVCAYPKITPVPFREEDLWNGYPEETNAPYGLAKKLLLVQAQAYRQQYGMNAIYLLPVNLYGPYDNFDRETSHVIPGMIRKFLEARNAGLDEVALWGDGSPTREFLHVRDAARAFRLALEGYDGSEPVNIGSGEEISIRDLANLIAAAAEYRGRIVWDTSKPNGQPRRKLDTSRAQAWFSFSSRIPFVEGITETVAWYTSALRASQVPN